MVLCICMLCGSKCNDQNWKARRVDECAEIKAAQLEVRRSPAAA